MTLVGMLPASASSATRTTMVTGLVWSAMPCSVARNVPWMPALAIAPSTSVISTALLSGKTFSSASEAVAIRPTTAVETVRMVRVPALTSMTRTPWW